LPPYNHDGEGAYNKATAAGDPAIVCLHKGNIAAPGSGRDSGAILHARDSMSSSDVTHKDKQLMSGNLPLFSRISLMRNMKVLQIMRVRASFDFEDVHRKAKARRKSARPRQKAQPDLGWKNVRTCLSAVPAVH
jgi:hypothetical protein